MKKFSAFIQKIEKILIIFTFLNLTVCHDGIIPVYDNRLAACAFDNDERKNSYNTNEWNTISYIYK